MNGDTVLMNVVGVAETATGIVLSLVQASGPQDVVLSEASLSGSRVNQWHAEEPFESGHTITLTRAFPVS